MTRRSDHLSLGLDDFKPRKEFCGSKGPFKLRESAEAFQGFKFRIRILEGVPELLEEVNIGVGDSKGTIGCNEGSQVIFPPRLGMSPSQAREYKEDLSTVCSERATGG